MISYCGLLCDSCPIRQATREKNESKQRLMRAEIARICCENYGMKMAAEDVTDCDGCGIAGGRLFTGCRSCEIRICAPEKKINSCAACNDFPCQKLDRVFQEDPQARTRLEKLRNNA